MGLMEQAKRNVIVELNRSAALKSRGLLGWAFGLCRSKMIDREARKCQLQLIQTLSLTGKKQLMLIECDGERFLVGGGSDSVQTMIRLRGAGASIVEMGKEVPPCR